MNFLNKCLENIQKAESVGGFAIDSFPTKKKKKKMPILLTNENIVVIEQKRAMIDLDGTIHKYSDGYKDGEIYDDAFKGAKEVINWLKSKGYEIVIFTTRASEYNAKEQGGDVKTQVVNIEKWLKEYHIKQKAKKYNV